MTIQRRAMSEEQKQIRREAILTATLRLFAEREYGAITMAEVAEAVQLVKGTLYLYFPTKEALFLALLEDQLNDWFAALDVGLAAITSVGAIEQVVALFDGTLGERPALTRLLAILYTILERNIDLMTARQFKQRLSAHLGATGPLLEGALSFLQPGDGTVVLLQCHALVVGLRSMADPAPVVRQLVTEPGLDLFAVDFAPQFTQMLRALLHGMAYLAQHTVLATIEEI